MFSRDSYNLNTSLVFVAMPFAATFNTLYESIENLVHNHCHLHCVRGDTESAGTRIMSDVWRMTNEAMLVVADLSGRNPNVFYELGLAHALGKSVVLLTSDTADTPFDVRDIRAIRYDPAQGFRAIHGRLLDAIRASVVTLPIRWDTAKAGAATNGVVITHVEYPTTVSLRQPFEITTRARHDAPSRQEGYFSASFPDAVDEDIEIVDTDVSQRIGRTNDAWAAGRVILRYPITEAFENSWESGHEHYLKVRARSRQAGWLRFFVSASSNDDSRGWQFNPPEDAVYKDQRGEPVYCGIVDVTN